MRGSKARGYVIGMLSIVALVWIIGAILIVSEMINWHGRIELQSTYEGYNGMPLWVPVVISPIVIVVWFYIPYSLLIAYADDMIARQGLNDEEEL